MYLGLVSPKQKALFGACLLITVAGYLSITGRNYVAFRAAQQPEIEALRRATRLAPWNAVYWNRLGRLLAFVQQEFGPAIDPLQKAVEQNAHSAGYWIDLATAYQFLGQGNQQRRALERALQLDPRNPELAWQAANYYFVLGEADRGLGLMHFAVEGNPQLIQPALQLALRVTNNDFRRVLDEVLPPTPSLHLQAVRYMVSVGNSAAADESWKRLIDLKQPFDGRQAQVYMDNLYQRGKSAALRQAWADMTGVLPGLADHRGEPDNLIVNGGFEHPVLNLGLDWCYSPQPAVRVQTDSANLNSGTSSLLISFEGQRASDTGLRQLVPVERNTCYEFSGSMRTRSLEGAGGLRFVIRESPGGHLYFVSEGPIGTHAWSEVRSTFRTAATTDFLTVSLERARLTVARGEVWIDDLRLELSQRCEE